MSLLIRRLRKRLKEKLRVLQLIDERIASYTFQTEVPIPLLVDQSKLTKEVRQLRQQIRQRLPIEILRDSIKLLSDPVPAALYGECWEEVAAALLAATVRGHPETPERKVIWAASPRLYRLNDDLRLYLKLHRRGQPAAMRPFLAMVACSLARELASLFPAYHADLDALISMLNSTAGAFGWRPKEYSDEVQV